MRRNTNILNKLDWTTTGIYLLLIFIGWISVYASVYNEEHRSIFDITQRYGMQLIWIITGLFLALMVVLVDQKLFSVFAYLIYGCIICLLLLVLVAGVEVNGSRSWFMLGPIRLQPAELAKLATALALAKLMSGHNFKLSKISNLLKIGAIIMLPIGLILLQHDTGSALVFSSFLVMLYREGLSGWLVSIVAFCAVIFILSIIWLPVSVFIFLWIVSLVIYTFFRRNLFEGLIIAAISFGLYFSTTKLIMPLLKGIHLANEHVFLISCGIILFAGAIIAIKKKIRYFWPIMLFFIGAVFISSSVDYVYDNLLQAHHRARIEDMLGLKEDLQGAGYNVHQSKGAIGSGGFFGKGLLQGTQTKYNFVPEQSTDFIFCTIGEEWGFIGVLVVIALYVWLLIRIADISERQRDAFARIYGYCVLSVISFHVIINIAMTIGLAPVIGIPLPFISYGGSSLWAFTIMLFILLKFDAVKWD